MFICSCVAALFFFFSFFQEKKFFSWNLIRRFLKSSYVVAIPYKIVIDLFSYVARI